MTQNWDSDLRNTVGNLMDAFSSAPLNLQPKDAAKDGIIHCGECGEPKQAWIDWLPDEDGNPQKRLVPVLCKCQRDEFQKEADRQRDIKFRDSLKELRAALGIKGTEAGRWTFADDDAPHTSIARMCRRYVDKWSEMRRDNLGIMLYGSQGSGKTFYATCLVNELARKRVLTAMTTTPRLMAVLHDADDRNEVIEAAQRVSLLVLDDFGAERETSYAAELLYSIVDARYQAQKPLIVTTNLSLEEMGNETNLMRSRIYDRVIEMCPLAIKMDGESKRGVIADERRKKAREILRG